MLKLNHTLLVVKKEWTTFTDLLGNTVVHPQYIAKSNAQFAVHLAKKYVHGKLLDIGCGTMSYRKYVEPLVDQYIGLDYPLTSKMYPAKIQPDILADAKKLPIRKESFDSILMLQVLEHIDDPLTALKEANRVLKKGEYLILSTPFMYPLHDSPNDYFRYTQFALKKLLTDSGFKVINIYAKGNFLEFWLQSLIVFSLKRIKDIIWHKLSIGSFMQLIFMLIILSFYPLFNFCVILLEPLLNTASSKFSNPFPLVYVAVAKKPK